MTRAAALPNRRRVSPERRSHADARGVLSRPERSGCIPLSRAAGTIGGYVPAVRFNLCQVLLVARCQALYGTANQFADTLPVVAPSRVRHGSDIAMDCLLWNRNRIANRP